MSSLLHGTRLILANNLLKVTHVALYRGPNILRDHMLCASSAFTRKLTVDASPKPDILAEATKMDVVSKRNIGRLTDVQRQLELMDSNVRWRGRIDREQVEAVLDAAKKESLSDQQALMLIRCAGSLMVKESPQKRIRIFNEIWDTLKQQGATLNTSHYNAAVRVQLENKQAFLVTDILSEMDSLAEAKPNRVTYQLLVERYCQEGDLDGATTILQYMKTQNFPITELVFNQLLVGHLKNGDVEGAKGVLESMRSSNLHPSKDTYKSMLCCYAEKGDMEAINKTLSDAEKDDVHIPTSYLYSVVLVLADSGHKGLVEQMLAHIPGGANHDALNTVHQLIARGCDESALLIYYAHLNPDNSASDNAQAGARAVLRTMVINDRPIEKLKSAMDSLRVNGHLVDGDVDVLTLLALTYQKPELALGAIKLMNESGLAVRPHFFWPILIQFNEANNIDGICDTIGLLTEAAEKNADYIPTLYDNIFRKLLSKLKDETAVVTRLKEAGMKTEDLNTLQLLHLLSNGNMVEAQQFLDSELDVTFQFDAFKEALISGVQKTQDKLAMCKVIDKLQEKSNYRRNFFNGIILNAMLSRQAISKQDKLDLAQAWVDQKLPTNTLSLEKITSSLTKIGASESLIEQLTDSVTPDRIQAMDMKEARALSVANLETELKTRRPKDRDLNVIRKQLLVKYCSSGDIANADTLKTTLEKDNFVFDAETLRQLSHLAAVHKRDLNEALTYKQQMEAKHPDFKYYQLLLLNIGSLQADKGSFADAIKTLESYGKLHGDVTVQLTDEFKYFGLKEVNTILASFRSGASPSEMRQLVDVLFKYSFVSNGYYDALVEVVNSYISSGDMDGLMDVLKLYYREYERVPNYQSVFRALVERKDAEKLEQVVDMATNLKNSEGILLKLAMACIDCQQTSKAAKIMETPGLRAEMNVLKTGMTDYIRGAKERELRDLVNVTRDLFGVDREEMLFGIVRFYGHQSDADGCKSVLDLYDEQSVVPSPRTLRYIAKVCESLGKEVHFDVPAVSDDSSRKFNREGTDQPEGPVATNELEEQIIKACRFDDMPSLLNALNKKSDEECVSSQVLSYVCAKLFANREIQSLKQLIKELKEDELWSIEKDNNRTRQTSNFVKRELLLRYVTGEIDNPEKKAEIIDELDTKPGLIHQYFSSNRVLTGLSETDPPLFTKIVNLINEQLEAYPQNTKAAQALFECYIERKQDNDAEQLFAKNDEFQKRLRMLIPARILHTAATSSKDETRLMWLLNLAKSVSVRKTTSVYSQLVELRSATDPESALRAVEQARSDGLEYMFLFKPTMRSLEEKLTTAKIKVPWTPGMFAEE